MLSGKYWKISYALGLSRALSAPYYVNIEPTNHCNLRCMICSRKPGTPRGYMSLDVFKGIIDQCAQLGVQQVSLFLGGESTLHRDLPEMVAYVERKGLVSGLHTNGTILSPNKSRQLLEAGLSQISVSLDGKTPEEYEHVRKGAKYDRTMANILAFLELKRRQGNRRPHTIIQTIRPFLPEMQDKNGRIHYPEPEAEFVRRFEELPVDEIRVLLPHTWRGEKTDIPSRPLGPVYFRCKHLWMGLSIAWDGSAVGCCNDLNRIHVRGSVVKDGLRAIWDGEDARRLRRLQVQRKYGEIMLCRDCHELWRDEHPARELARKIPILSRARRLLVRPCLT